MSTGLMNVTLRLEITELLKQWHLKDLLSEHSRATRDKILYETNDNTPLVPPRIDRTINMINDGFEVRGVSYVVVERSSHRAIRSDLHKIGHHDPGI